MTSLIHPVKIFGGSASQELTKAICEFYGALPGQLSVSRFSDGEFQPNFHESVRGCDVFIVQSTYPNSDNLMELLMAIDAAKRASANYITAVVPYYGFARQDRKDKPRVSIASKLVADLLGTAGANRVMTMELHAPQIQGFFNVPVDQMLNLPMVICDKERKKANEIANMTVIGDVEGKDVVLIDDIIDTGGTLCKAAAMLTEKGAKTVRALCCHPVLSGKAYENIEGSVLTELVVTDTIPLKKHIEKIKVLSVAPLWARAIRNVHENGSISSLYKQVINSQTSLDLQQIK